MFRIASRRAPLRALQRLSVARPVQVKTCPGANAQHTQHTEHTEEKKDSFFITTPIYYVNGDPHLGHAYTSVAADVLARYNRLMGKKVFFLSGTDEHGQKVEQSALQCSQTPLKFATTNSAKFRNLLFALHCSHDDFIRTTEDRHKQAVLALWRRLEENGSIYLGAYEGWYSIRDEAFYAENELVNGRAPTGAEVQWVKEESYFFRLSQWTERLLQLYEENPFFICPPGRKKEVVAFLSQPGGLRDLSISRTTFNWGIPVPSDPKHVVYVWLDALTNYISALGYPDLQAEKLKAFWPAAVHVVGKDILRFHAVFWPAFVMAAGLEPPKRIFAHGWWTKDGEKMSKSLGNVIDPVELLELYGVDYVRYFLSSEIHFGNDGDFSHEAFAAKINTELANDLGNLLQRVGTFVRRHCDGKIPSPGALSEEDEEVLRCVRETADKVQEALQSQSIKTICDLVMHLAKTGNRYIDAQAPWQLVKQPADHARMHTVLHALANLLRATAVLLQPVVPHSAELMLQQLGIPAELRTFASVYEPLPAGLAIGEPSPVFPKIDLSQRKEQVESGGKQRAQSKQQVQEDILRRLNAKYVSSLDAVTNEELMKMIHDVGDHIRQLKLEKVSKSSLEPFVMELNYLKERYKVMFDPIPFVVKQKASQ